MRLQGLMQSQSPYFHSPILMQLQLMCSWAKIRELNDQSCVVDFHKYGGVLLSVALCGGGGPFYLQNLAKAELVVRICRPQSGAA